MSDLIKSEQELDDRLTTPSARLVSSVRQLSSPLVLLGAGGKMGPSLAALAVRAAAQANHSIEVVAASRFSDQAARRWLDERGVRTMEVDLLDRTSLARLPDSKNVIYLAGIKFGTTENPALTWALNTLGPANAAERYAGSRIVALSTGNVYPFTDVNSGGATEAAPLTPVGEYPNAAVARERVFQYFSQQTRTPIALIRLSYAVDLRYGVLVDIAQKIWSGLPVDVSNSAFNCIWQGDANEMILRAFTIASLPAQAWNLTGPEKLRVREVAGMFAQLMGKLAHLVGTEQPTALLTDTAKLSSALGQPQITAETLILWIAHWLRSGGRLLGKPTHFEVRDGAY